jgi:hypothetical protein
MTMKNILIFAICCCSFLLGRAQSPDTIYVICHQEAIKERIFSISSEKGQLQMFLFFDIKWQLHGQQQDSFIFVYTGPPAPKSRLWGPAMIDEKSLRSFKNVLSLQELTEKLKGPFLVSASSQKYQFILVLSGSGSQRYELYPVKIGTDLSSEG